MEAEESFARLFCYKITTIILHFFKNLELLMMAEGGKRRERRSG